MISVDDPGAMYGIQGGAPVMWTLAYNPHEYYRYYPLINPSYSTYKPRNYEITPSN